MTVVLQYPPTSPTDTLTLPDPDLGNTRGINTRVRHMVAMNGAVRTYKSTPVLEILTFNFSNLTPTQTSALITFIETSIGSMIALTDWDSVTWRGQLITDPQLITTDGRNWCATIVEHRSASVVFEGEKLPFDAVTILENNFGWGLEFGDLIMTEDYSG